MHLHPGPCAISCSDVGCRRNDGGEEPRRSGEVVSRILPKSGKAPLCDRQTAPRLKSPQLTEFAVTTAIWKVYAEIVLLQSLDTEDYEAWGESVIKLIGLVQRRGLDREEGAGEGAGVCRAVRGGSISGCARATASSA